MILMEANELKASKVFKGIILPQKSMTRKQSSSLYIVTEKKQSEKGIVCKTPVGSPLKMLNKKELARIQNQEPCKTKARELSLRANTVSI